MLFTTRHARIARALIGASILALAACSGGGSSPGIPSNGLCDAGAEFLQIARPSPGFTMNGNAIEIVSSTSNDALHGNPTVFDLDLVDQFGQTITTGGLTLVPDPNGPHPYTNDFFYQGTLSTGLLPNRSYNVYLNVPSSGCQRGQIGQIFT